MAAAPAPLNLKMSQDNFNLAGAARQEMIEHGFEPEFPPEAERQLQTIHAAAGKDLRDLTSLLWSSIDNDDSRDLDQIEWAERVPEGIRVRVGVADVDSAVAKGTPIDQHAARETTTVYTGVRTFPCCQSSSPPASPRSTSSKFGQPS